MLSLKEEVSEFMSESTEIHWGSAAQLIHAAFRLESGFKTLRGYPNETNNEQTPFWAVTHRWALVTECGMKQAAFPGAIEVCSIHSLRAYQYQKHGSFSKYSRIENANQFFLKKVLSRRKYNSTTIISIALLRKCKKFNDLEKVLQYNHGSSPLR